MSEPMGLGFRDFGFRVWALGMLCMVWFGGRREPNRPKPHGRGPWRNCHANANCFPNSASISGVFLTTGSFYDSLTR